MACNLCQSSPKYWEGDDRKCAFDGQPPADNWNCATLIELRRVLEAMLGRMSQIQYHGIDEQHYYLIRTSDIPVEEVFDFVWVSYYKNRGRTECVHALGDAEPRWLTETEVLALIKMLDVEHQNPDIKSPDG